MDWRGLARSNIQFVKQGIKQGRLGRVRTRPKPLLLFHSAAILLLSLFRSVSLTEQVKQAGARDVHFLSRILLQPGRFPTVSVIFAKFNFIAMVLKRFRCLLKI